MCLRLRPDTLIELRLPGITNGVPIALRSGVLAADEIR